MLLVYQTGFTHEEYEKFGWMRGWLERKNKKNRSSQQSYTCECRLTLLIGTCLIDFCKFTSNLSFEGKLSSYHRP